MILFRLIAIFFCILISANFTFISAESFDKSTTVFARKNKNITFSVLNGNEWHKLSSQSKIMYLNGLSDGISLLSLRMVDSKRSSEDQD